jgi:hypothetical protein
VNLKRLLFSLFLAILVGGMAITPALAFPPLPSSFYGLVKANGQNVPDGTLVRALIAGKAYAETRTQTYQGDSVFNMNVPGDEADTTPIEGGKEGEAVQFEVGGVVANESGVWHSGTNVKVDLTVTASGPLATPPPAPPAVPTQTAISAVVAVTPTAGASSNGAASADSSSTTLVIGAIVAGVVIVGAGWVLSRRKK